MNASIAKELLLPIPSEDFITNNFTDGITKCCAVGHLVRLTSKEPNNFNMDNCADIENVLGYVKTGKENVFNFCRTKTNEFLVTKYNVSSSINLANVNNHDTINGYNQDNPKDRVIALLDDMIESGY